MFRIRQIILLTPCILISGCGLYLPDKEEFFQDHESEKLYENTIVNNIKCELTKGVYDTLYGKDGGIHNNIKWLESWGATVNLKLTIDEKSSLSPGGSVTDIMHNAITPFAVGGNVTSPQSFTLGFGATGTADTTRIETIAFLYEFKNLIAEYKRSPIPSCSEHEKGILIESDLKIGQFISDKVFIAAVPGSTEPKKDAGPFSVFSYQATFVSSYGGNLTPTWKFARASANPTGMLISSSRQKTNDLTITLGPIKPATKTSAASISPEAQDVQFAHLIGQAVATAIQSQQH